MNRTLLLFSFDFCLVFLSYKAIVWLQKTLNVAHAFFFWSFWSLKAPVLIQFHYIDLCPGYSSKMAWEWVDNDRIYIFRWTIALHKTRNRHKIIVNSAQRKSQFHWRNSLLEKTPFRFMYFPVKRKSAYSAFYSNPFLTPPSVLHVHSSHSTPFLSHLPAVSPHSCTPSFTFSILHSPLSVAVSSAHLSTHSNLCSSHSLSLRPSFLSIISSLSMFKLTI